MEAAIDIARWLQGIGLAEHIETFRAEKIDAAVLPTLTDADLRELGLPLGDRKRLRAAIEALAAAPEPSRAATSRMAAEQRHLTCNVLRPRRVDTPRRDA